MNRRTWFLGFVLAILVLQGCSSLKYQAHTSEMLKSNEHRLMAVLYQQRAAEYRALCYQAFNTAKLMIDRDSRPMGLQKKGAVVVDVDETILDNSPYEARLIFENKSYPTHWTEWCEVADARPVPGALEFLNYASKKGYSIFYITNRTEKFKEKTYLNLKNAGFPQVSPDHLMCKKNRNSKNGRRKSVEKNHRIALLIGDNLNDFSEVFEKKDVAERSKITDKMRKEFGSHFIVLPNAMYGAWENALYDYKKSKSEEKKALDRQKHLIGF